VRGHGFMAGRSHMEFLAKEKEKLAGQLSLLSG
jgi:hypothetical protein